MTVQELRSELARYNAEKRVVIRCPHKCPHKKCPYRDGIREPLPAHSAYNGEPTLTL